MKKKCFALFWKYIAGEITIWEMNRELDKLESKQRQFVWARRARA